MFNTFFQGERKIFEGGLPPCTPIVTGLNVPIEIGKCTQAGNPCVIM